MRPIIVPDKRGKGRKVTLDMIRTIITIAKQYRAKGRRIRLQGFSRMLTEEKNILLSSKTVGDILTANDLRSPKTRRQRPGFYQKLRQSIPNGLISVDGSEIKLHINDQIIKLNLEMAVDTNSFAHTAFSVSKQESSEEFIKVMKAHIQQWGIPLGLVCDSGSANLSDASQNFLDSYDIIPVPAGPGNPKGNGSIESAFSLFKKTVGTIQIDTSSPEALAKSVLETVVSVYIKMRNCLPLKRQVPSPEQNMKRQASEDIKIDLRQKLIYHRGNKNGSNDDDKKIDLIHCLIKTMGIPAEKAAVSRAEKSIPFYSMKAILETEKIFVKAVNRKKDRLSLPYFFGILKRVQQEQDDQSYKRHCQERYNYAEMKKQIIDQQKQKTSQRASTVQDVLKILVSAVTISAKKIKDMALRRAKEWTDELIKVTKYVGTLRKKFQDALARMPQLQPVVKEQVLAHVDILLNYKQ